MGGVELSWPAVISVIACNNTVSGVIIYCISLLTYYCTVEQTGLLPALVVCSRGMLSTYIRGVVYSVTGEVYGGYDASAGTMHNRQRYWLVRNMMKKIRRYMDRIEIYVLQSLIFQ